MCRIKTRLRAIPDRLKLHSLGAPLHLDTYCEPVGRTQFIVEVGGQEVARIALPPGKLEKCRATAIGVADDVAGEHPARVFVMEAPWDIGPMVGERQLVYEAADRRHGNAP
jgi:hypothetical protein